MAQRCTHYLEQTGIQISVSDAATLSPSLGV